MSSKDQASELRELITTLPGEAVRLALTMSPSAVEKAVNDEFTEANAHAADAFFQRWISALPPLEGLAAAYAVSDRYVLDLVWLPTASDRGIGMELASMAKGLACLAEGFGYLRGLSESPDATFGVQLVERYEEVAKQFRKIAGMAEEDGRVLLGGAS